jgi:hypothetical protein
MLPAEESRQLPVQWNVFTVNETDWQPASSHEDRES